VTFILRYLTREVGHSAPLALLFLCVFGFGGSVPFESQAIAAERSRSGNAGDSYYGKKVGSIEVKGSKRIEKDAILAKISTKTGSILTKEGIHNDITTLFAMGFFEDIAVDADPSADGVKLTFTIQERPVISKISFQGNQRIDSGDLKDVLKLKEWAILDVNKVKNDVALIQKHYEEKGFYLAKVDFDITRDESSKNKLDEVQLIYKINDYEKVQIKRITFLNNKAFTDEKLKGVFGDTKEGGFFSFLSSSGNFKESAFKQDLAKLTFFYLEHGYIKFKYENPVVTVSDDKKWIFISLYLDEGEQYSMGLTSFGGDMLFTRDELARDVSLETGDIFSITKRNADIQRLTEKYQDLGYAFVNVIPKMSFHDDVKTVDIEYDFEKGNLVYFNEINIYGNSKTYDKVIRRELKVHEGDLFNGTRLRESRESVERLGYFAPGEVIFNTVTPKGKNDMVNLEITVKERPTGTITLGAGYGSQQGFFLSTQISEINLMGRGHTLSLAGQLAKDPRMRSINLGFTEPYLMDTRISSGFDVFYQTFPIPDKYTTRKLGFDVRFGYPVMEYTYGYLTYKNEGLHIEDVVDPSISQEDIDADTGNLSSVIFSIVRDKRNNRFETTSGNYQSISFETAGLGGDKKYLKLILNARYYKKLVGDLVFRTNAEVGQINGFGGRPVPPSEKFFLGGPNNLKGFYPLTVGPKRERVSSTGATFYEPTGGLTEVFALFELEYPLVKDAGLKWVVFYDIGNAFNGWDPVSNLKLRSDAGFGLRWFSPIGPLRFEWGFPFNPQQGESTPVFNFFIGPPF
jgi:outer membrane protein insertion porin family